MNNPNINRILGYIGIMIGCVIWCCGFHYPTEDDPVNGHNPVLIVIALIIIIAAFIWLIMKVRCPYCHKLLSDRSERAELYESSRTITYYTANTFQTACCI